MIRPLPRFAILSAALLVTLATPALGFRHKETQGPATLEARSDSDGDTMGLADVLHVTVTIEGIKGLEVDGPLRLAEGAAWDVVATSPPRLKTEEDGQVRWQQTLTLAPKAPGDQSLSVAPVTFRSSEGDKQTLRWTPFAVKIVTTIKDVDVRGTRDISAIEDPPPLPALINPWPWVGGAAVVVVVAFAGGWLVLRQRVRSMPSSALQRAMRECARVQALSLADGKSRVILLTGVVRRYLERRCGIPARRLTTTELMRLIDGRGDMATDTKNWLRDFLAQTDLIKYAGATVSEERGRELVDEARQFLVNTSTPS